MSTLLPAVPALVVVACVALFTVGLQYVRADPSDGMDVGDLALLRGEQRKDADGRGPLDRIAAPLVPLFTKAMGAGLEERLRRMIELAGRPEGATVDTVVLRMAVLLVISLPVGLLLAVQGVFWGLLLVPAVVFLLPLGRISRLRRLRQESISDDLPDFLDVLAVTVTAGVGFRSALQTVSDRFGGALGGEIILTLNQIRNGSSVRESFRKLRDRNDSEPLAQFVTAYLQSEELGAPLSLTLSRIAEDMRRESAQRQRQKANKVVPQVTLVTTFFLVPGALVLLIAGFYLGVDFDISSLTGEFE